jgi:N-acetylmuramoyl-L-alanine amidase
MKNVKAGHTRPIVCLDAGHYGKYNRSPVVPEYYESDMNWKLHLMLEDELEKYGIQVILTREDQKRDLGLKDRGRASKGCDLLLSIHSNSAERESADYPVVYYPISGVAADLAKSLAVLIKNTMGTVEKCQAKSRKGGGDWDYYSVIYGATEVGTPALILEHSFYTNTKSAKWLMDDNNLRKMAREEAKVIAQWFDVEKSDDNPVKNTVTVEMSVLKKGDKGAQVNALQALLIGYGYKMENNGVTYGVDGSFGSATDRAVRNYQVHNNLEADGSVGPATWGSLLKQ